MSSVILITQFHSLIPIPVHRLVDPGGTRTCLQYIDISGCSMITDTTLLRIAWACSPTSPTSSLCSNCSCGQMIEDTNMIRVKEETPQLKGLVLSGCHHVTDVGLKYVVNV